MTLQELIETINEKEPPASEIAVLLRDLETCPHFIEHSCNQIEFCECSEAEI